MDFDYFLRYLAAEVAINHWDGSRTWYSDAKKEEWFNNHNYYFYEEENIGGKIWIIPWDMDQTFWPWDYKITLDSKLSKTIDPIFERAVPNWNVPVPEADCKPIWVTRLDNAYITPPNCDKLFKLTASVYGDRYAQLGKQFLNDQYQNQRLIAKIDKYSELIKESVKNDLNILDDKGTTWIKDNWKTFVNELKESLPDRAAMLKKNLETQ